MPFADWVSLPFRQAIEEFLKRKVMPRKAFDKLSDAYKQRAFTVGTGYKNFAIEQTRLEIKAALEQGISIGEFKRDMRSFFGAQGLTRDSDHHLFTVFQTNTLGSYSHGRYRQLTTPTMRLTRPAWKYATAGDSRVREAHRELAGMIRLATDPIWETHFPPNGFCCRCTVEALSLEEATEEGIGSGAAPAEPDEGFAGSPAEWLD